MKSNLQSKTASTGSFKSTTPTKRGNNTLQDSQKSMFVLGMYELYLKGSTAKQNKKP